MAKLTFDELESLSTVFSMKQGYVLDFSNRTFSDFLKDIANIDVYSGEFNRDGTSKAKLFRAVLESLGDERVAEIIRALLARERKRPNLDIYPLVSNTDREAVSAIARRLSNETIERLPRLTRASVHVVFKRVRDEVERYLNLKSYDAGLDRLHTFVTLYLRLLVSNAAKNSPSSDFPLHSLMGTHIKNLCGAGHTLSEMTLRILRSSISTLESFNHIRNQHSLAHPTEQLTRQEEAEFIFSHVVALVCLLEKLDAGPVTE